MTDAEAGAALDEVADVLKALRGFREEGVADPLAAARAAVAKTRAQDFDSRSSALSRAVQSVDYVIRAAGAVSASLGNIASAESVRDGAAPDLLGVVNHVVARENMYQAMVNGRVNVTAAMLERDFRISGNIVERDDSGRPRLGMFELSHARYGKLLSVDDDGNVTLHEQNGSDMDATAYVKALFGGGSVFSIINTDFGNRVVDRRM
ncbi:hypothetical protein [Paracoccus marinaquae]|uniref:Uncharacterized protein n=1 Tax=Paracoccus marinaquae TaxID=2841926 RepID=A0ABS6AN32_9RHOB|nr:hypothetical protein [Paracoccus marinaquae]MBU3032008.1 hypothetical protein [Paracoccus marinaquae]